jgi:hypothetical protein
MMTPAGPQPQVVIDHPRRRIVIQVTDKMIRAWWTRNHPRGHVPPRRRAFFTMLREILFEPFRWALSIPESADRPTAPVPPPAAHRPPRKLTAVHLLTCVYSIAPPTSRRTIIVGRLTS